MKTAELEGAALDYWVARSDPKKASIRWAPVGGNYLGFCRIGNSPEFLGLIIVGHEGAEIPPGVRQYSPSTNWAEGGPLLSQMIESGEFCVWEYDGMVTVSNMDQEGLPCKEPRRDDIAIIQGEDKKLLIAAMRAFVASKFGDEVPDIKETA